MGAHAQKRNLFLNKDSGIYGKGERSIVTYRGEALAQDSLTVRVMSNNRLVLTDRIWPEGTDFTVFAATIDTTCPPSAVWSSLNGAPGKKTIHCVPFRTHAWPSGENYPVWNQLYYQPRLDFISNYLK